MTSAVPQAEHVHVLLDPASVVAAYGRHRRRFAESVAALDGESLAAASRCDRWSVADVLRHGIDVDGWMHCIWAGRPLPFDNFDPLRTPDEFVMAGRAVSDAEVRDRYVTSAEEMAVEVETSGPDRWGVRAFSPLGPVPWWLSAMHVFYDSWVHERDALLPLQADVPAESDEVVPALTYTLAVIGVLSREPNDIVVAGVRLSSGAGPTVAEPQAGADPDAGLVDALSGRGPLDAALGDVDAESAHRLGVLSRYFTS